MREHEARRTRPDDDDVGLAFVHAPSSGLEAAQRGELVSGRRGDLLHVGGDGEVPTGRAADVVDRDARMQRRQRQLTRQRIGTEDAEVGDDDLRTAAA